MRDYSHDFRGATPDSLARAMLRPVNKEARERERAHKQRNKAGRNTNQADGGTSSERPAPDADSG